jgi:DNA excision repair protein ERCC-3
MSYNPENALIVQSDRTILLEVHAPTAEAAREAIRRIFRRNESY